MKISALAPLLPILLLAPVAWAQSTWNVTSGDWNTAGNWIGGVPTASVEAFIGTTSSNRTATVTSASAAARGVVIGNNSGEVGTVIVNGGILNSYSNLQVGNAGNGTLNILSGGKLLVHNGFPVVGTFNGSTGLVSVAGAGSQLVSDYGLTVGNLGAGTLTVSAGGKTTTGSGYGTTLADSGSGATGTLNLIGTSGSRGMLETAYIIEGGGSGGGHINFNGGILRATADSTNFLQGFEAADVQVASGGAFLDSNGHNVTINSTVQFNGSGGITKQGAGTLTLSGDRKYYGNNFVVQGTLANTGYGILGNASGDTSSMTVSGSGSQWSNGGTLVVGSSGNGTLTVDAGGKVLSGVGYGTVLADSGSATGTLILNGTSGSRGVLETAYISEGSGSGSGHINFNGGILRAIADSTDFLQNFEVGDVQVQSGGAFVDTQSFNVGISTGLQGAGGLTKQGTGTLTLTGMSSFTGGMEVSGGSLNLQSGGTVGGGYGFIAPSSGSIGAVTVSGVGSQWTNGNGLHVGSSGNGALTIQNGGTVSNTDGYIGDNAGSISSVTVTGTGSQWNSSGYLILAAAGGRATLTIQNGGMVSNAGAAGIGVGGGGQGAVTVDGVGSQWINGGGLSVGDNGSGTLTIQNGGAVSNTYAASIGFASGGQGTVMVTGSGSRWINGSNLFVGNSGSGMLTADAGGKINAPRVYMAYFGSAQGTLNLNGTGGSRGALETTFVSKGGGTGGGHIHFNGGILRATADSADFLQNFEAGDVQIQSDGAFIDTNGHDVTIATALQGSGGLTKQGAGTLTLTGAHSYTGTTTVSQGRLAVNGNISTSITTVDSGGSLGGSGTVGAVHVMSGGTLAAGNSIESLATGNLTLSGGSTFDYEMNSAAAPGAAGDLTAVNGTLDLSPLNDVNLSLTELGSGSWSLGEKLTLISYSGAWNGGLFKLGGHTLADDSIFAFSGMDWRFDYNDSSAGGNWASDLTGPGFVTMTAIPEPGTLLFVGCGSLVLFRRRRIPARRETVRIEALPGR